MPAGIVLAGGRSSRMGAPKAWLEWRGATLLEHTCEVVARGTGGPVVVVRAPGQELPALPAEVRVVEDAREGRGPLQGLLAGLLAVEDEVAFAAAVDLPLLHPRFVAAVCAAIGDADAAVPYLDGFDQPLAAAYRTALAPLVAELLDAGALGFPALLERCAVRTPRDLPHPESVRNVNTRADYEAL
jgi:molybdenum cofactor guanylyltransferase